MKTNKLETTIASKLNELTKEREELVTYMQELSQRFEAAKQRIAALNGSIETLNELIPQEGKDSNDSENKAE